MVPLADNDTMVIQYEHNNQSKGLITAHQCQVLGPASNFLTTSSLWDAATSQLLTSLISHERQVNGLHFSPRNNDDDDDNVDFFLQLISVSDDKSLKVTFVFIPSE